MEKKVWYDKANLWYLKHKEHVDKLIENNRGHYFAPSHEDTRHPELWKAGSWGWFFNLDANLDEKMCHYHNVYGMSRSKCDEWNGADEEAWAEESKRVRCPACGQSMMSTIRVCHDGCCIYHCIPKHKKKGWWRKKNKKQSRDNKMRRR